MKSAVGPCLSSSNIYNILKKAYCDILWFIVITINIIVLPSPTCYLVTVACGCHLPTRPIILCHERMHCPIKSQIRLHCTQRVLKIYFSDIRGRLYTLRHFGYIAVIRLYAVLKMYKVIFFLLHVV